MLILENERGNLLLNLNQLDFLNITERALNDPHRFNND
jgi:hypothetical protein